MADDQADRERRVDTRSQAGEDETRQGGAAAAAMTRRARASYENSPVEMRRLRCCRRSSCSGWRPLSLYCCCLRRWTRGVCGMSAIRTLDSTVSTTRVEPWATG